VEPGIDEPVPPVVRRVTGLLAVEGVALLGTAVVDAVATATGSPADRGLSFAVAGFALAGGGVLMLLAQAIRRRRGWARSPAVVLQLLALPVGVGLLQGHVWAAGVPVLLLAAATLWHLMAAGSALAAD
jgi:hypothetical protein